jgi:hypothetical protein
MEKEIVVNDYYEAAFLLLNQCRLVSFESKLAGSRIICEFTLSGSDISRKHLTYLNGEAEANILNLRRMVHQIQIWAYSAKKQFKKQCHEAHQKQRQSQQAEVSHEAL